jgi:hypothetical protein
MIITLKGANFANSNIGTLDSYSIRFVGSGVTNSNTSVDRESNTGYTTTITLGTGYELNGSITVTMGGTDITSTAVSGLTITIPTKVTGNVVITVPTKNTAGGSQEPDTPDTPDTPDEPDTPTGTTWYINSLDQIAATGKDLTTGTWMTTAEKYTPWAFADNLNNKLVGKTINAIELVPNRAGTFHYGKYNNSTGTYTSVGSFTITDSDLNVRKIYQFTPYSIASGEYFTFNEDGDTGAASYFLAKDIDTTAVECVSKMYQACENGGKADFTYDMVIVMNVGYIGENGDSGNSGGSTGGSGNTTWYINSLQQLQDSGNDIATNRVELAPNSSYHWAFNQFNSKLTGKTVNTIELMPCKSGTFTLGIFDTSSNTVTDTRSVTVNAADINTVKTYTFDDLTIPSDKYFVWNCSGKGTKDGEASGYYVLKDKLDPLAVETSQWYQAKRTGLAAFSNYWLAFVANIGYTE